MELREYFSALRHRWLTVAICTVVGVALGVFYNASAAKTYQADARSFVSVVSGSTSADSNSIYAASQFALQRMKSYTELGDSNQVLEPVLTSLKLPGSVSKLAKHVTVTNPASTVVLDIAVTYSNPDDAARIANAVAESLGKVIQDLELTTPGRSSPVVVTVTKRAVAISTPVTPRTKLDLALALVLGLCVGLAVAIVRERLDRSIRTSDDVAAVLGGPAIGLLGKRIDASDQARALLDQHALLRESEALRTLRTGLALTNHGTLPRSFVICSVKDPLSVATVTGLAEVIGRAGAAVCVIEADLRQPRVARFLSVEPVGGLATDLATNGESEAELHDVAARSFTLIAAGDEGAVDPGLMLGSSRMHAILEDLAVLFDVVIVIAPPILSADDARVIGRQTDGVLLVCEYGKSTQAELTTATSSLVAAECHPLGVVLTGLPARALKRADGGRSAQAATSSSAAAAPKPGKAPRPAASAAPSPASAPVKVDDEQTSIPLTEESLAEDAPAEEVADPGLAAEAAKAADRTVRRGPRRPVTRPRVGVRSPKPTLRDVGPTEDDMNADLGVASAPDSR